MGAAVAGRVMVRRVDAVGVRPQSVTDRMPGLIHVLERWAMWSESFRVHLGFPRQAIGLATGDGHEARSVDLQDQREAWVCECVDAAVGDLPPTQAMAIKRRYGLISAVVRFPRDNYVELLDAAHTTLLSTISRKGVDV